MKPLPLALIAGILLLTLQPARVFAADLEIRDRTVDQAALLSKLDAIRQMKNLIARTRGTSQEPSLLIYLAELQHDCADLEFRTAHGLSMLRHQPVDLRQYQAMLSDSVRVLSDFITRFPNNGKIARAHYLRAKALVESDHKAAAIRDLNIVVQRYSSNEDYKFSVVALVDILMSQKDYAGVLRTAALLRASPADWYYYSVEMDRSAWAEYYLNQIPQALKYLEAEASALRRGWGRKSAKADQDKTYDGIALFYVTGIERKLPGFSGNAAVSYAQSVVPGDLGAPILVQLAYLLRTRGLDDELEALNRSAGLSTLSDRTKQTLSLITIGNQVNHHRYAQLRACIDGLTRSWRPGLDGPELRRTVADTIASLQKAFADSTNTESEPLIGGSLNALYAIELSLADQAHQARIHFDMAEVSFALKDFGKATLHYRWVVEHPRGLAPTDRPLVTQSALKAVSSEYEALNRKNIFPKDLQPVSLQKDAEHPLPEDVTRWIDWVDSLPPMKDAEVFRFEADRMLYSMGHVRDAVERMKSQMVRDQDPRYAEPSAALVLDTDVATEDWDKTFAEAQQIASARPWSQGFQRKLQDILATSYFKTIESRYRAKDYAGVLDRSQKFIAAYPANANRDGCLGMAANAALALKDKARALSYFSELKSPQPELTSEMLLTQIAVDEEKHDFRSASKKIEAYLALAWVQEKLKPEDAAEMRKKAALYGFLADSSIPLAKRSGMRNICIEDTKAYCSHLDALIEIGSSRAPAKSEARAAFARSKRGSDRAVWSLIALKHPSAITLRERTEAIGTLSSRWADSDSIAQLMMIPCLAPELAATVEISRAEVSASRIRRIEKRAIQRRVRLLGELEELSAGMLKVPSSEAQIDSLNELAGAYADFARELRAIRAPKGLSGADLASYQGMIAQMTGPFEQKSGEFQKQAVDLSHRPGPTQDSSALSSSLEELKNGSDPLASAWASAVSAHRWNQVAYYIGQMKLSLSAGDFSKYETLSLNAARAQGVSDERTPASFAPSGRTPGGMR